jgi:hypothetical protein
VKVKPVGDHEDGLNGAGVLVRVGPRSISPRGCSVPRLIPPAMACGVHTAVAPKLVRGRTVSAT